jgi:hypothetical protein
MRIWTITLALFAMPLIAETQSPEQIPMHSKGAHTYYIESEIHGAGEFSMLVDTGSGYSVINENTLNQLVAAGKAEYIRRFRGKLSDGTERSFPLYRISSIRLGQNCIINDINVAVMPHAARQIIGLSTLIQAAPFSMSFDPPTLTLSQCRQPPLSNTAGELAKHEPLQRKLPDET